MTRAITHGLWRHYKGGLYRVLGRARWHEEPGHAIIFYTDIATGREYARPESEWEQIVDTPDGRRAPRFQSADPAPGVRWETPEEHTVKVMGRIEHAKRKTPPCQAKFIGSAPNSPARYVCAVCDVSWSADRPGFDCGRGPPAR